MSSTVTIVQGSIVTVDPDRRIIHKGGVAVSASEIVAVDTLENLTQAYPDAPVQGHDSDLVLPGYINGHQHLTGDRLIQSSIPDNLAPGEAIFTWVVPVHAEHRPADDELSATLTLAESLRNGITSTFEAGTVAHPHSVAAAAQRVGARVTIGTWGWDVEDGPFAGTVDEVLDRQHEVLNSSWGPLVTPWVSLVGHNLMSDDLITQASALAREHHTKITFHMSPSTDDTAAYLERTGRAPLVHLADLGVLGRHVVVAHAVHIDDKELQLLVEHETAVVSCPWAYLRLGQGISNQFRHLDLWKAGGRLALGCDAENAGDLVDGIRTAALFAGLAKDVPRDPQGFGAHEALELLTIKGAEALGVDHLVGSIEPGKQADLVVHDRRQLEWIPASPDSVLQLIWGSDGRSVRDVYVAGRQVVSDGSVVGLDLKDLAAKAAEAGVQLRQRSGVPPASRWG